jgi:hypothetical protein
LRNSTRPRSRPGSIAFGRSRTAGTVSSTSKNCCRRGASVNTRLSESTSCPSFQAILNHLSRRRRSRAPKKARKLSNSDTWGMVQQLQQIPSRGALARRFWSAAKQFWVGPSRRLAWLLTIGNVLLVFSPARGPIPPEHLESRHLQCPPASRNGNWKMAGRNRRSRSTDPGPNCLDIAHQRLRHIRLARGNVGGSNTPGNRTADTRPFGWAPGFEPGNGGIKIRQIPQQNQCAF